MSKDVKKTKVFRSESFIKMNILLPYLVRWNSLNRSRYYQILNCLASEGHEIHIVHPPLMKSKDTGFIETHEKLPENVSLHDLPINTFFWETSLPFNKIIKKGYYCLKINSSSKALIKKYNIDVVVIYNMALYPVTRLKNVLTVYDLGDDHIDLIAHELGIFSNKLTLSIAKKILKNTLIKSDVVFSVSQYLTKKYCEKSHILPNGVTLEDVHYGSGLEMRKKYKGPVIGFVGSLEYFISFDQIINVASSLRDYTFVIAGGGRQHDWILDEKKRLELDNLILTGGLPHAEILKHIDSFDICLNLFKKSPLTHGACPIKLFEYMAFKKPIISSRIDEVQRIDKEFLYWADTSEELESVIQKIIDNPGEASKKVDKAYDILVESYTWPQVASDFIKTTQNALKKKRAKS